MKTPFSILFFLLLSSCVTAFLEGQGYSSVKLRCSPYTAGGGGVTCVLTNESTEDHVFLATPFMLEGPLGSKGYICKYTAGGRFENIMEYGLPSVGSLGGPIQLKPVVHLTIDDLDFLRLLPAKSELFFEIDLKSVLAAYFSSSSKWLVRIKVIVATVADLKRLGDSGKLSGDDCSEKLFQAIPTSTATTDYVFTACAPKSGKRYRIDGCFDLISESFEHVYSNEFLLNVETNTPESSALSPNKNPDGTQNQR